MDTVQNDVKEFHSLHPNKKVQILGIIAVLFIISIGFGLYIAGKSPTTTTSDQNKDIVSQGATNLRIVPETAMVTKGNTIKVDVAVEGQGSQAIDVAITFDPKLVKVSNIVNGTVFPDMLRSDITSNQIIVSAAVDPNNPNDLKTGTLFSFTLEGVVAGDTTLAFDKNLTIPATNGVNTLGTAESVSLKVQ